MQTAHLKKEYDTIIIGAGPAGAAAARRLNEAGLETLILDKEKLPRYKMCSGLIFPDAQIFIAEHFGEIPGEVCCEPKFIKKIKIFPSADISLDNAVDLPLEMISENKGGGRVLLNVWRKEFDYWLAERSGAVVKDQCRFLGCARADDGTLEVECREKTAEKSIKIRTGYLVGADGGTSAVRKMIRPDFRKNLEWTVCWEEFYQGTIDLSPECFYGFMDKKFSELYMGVTRKDNIIAFQNGIRLGSKAKPFFRKFRDYLKSEHKFKPEKLVKTGGCLINNMAAGDNFLFGEGNILLAGEAAGFLNLLGEGISSALRTGRIAGDAIVESMDAKTDAILPYLKLVDKEKKRTLDQHRLGKNQGFDVF